MKRSIAATKSVNSFDGLVGIRLGDGPDDIIKPPAPQEEKPLKRWKVTIAICHDIRTNGTDPEEVQRKVLEFWKNNPQIDGEHSHAIVSCTEIDPKVDNRI